MWKCWRLYWHGATACRRAVSGCVWTKMRQSVRAQRQGECSPVVRLEAVFVVLVGCADVLSIPEPRGRTSPPLSPFCYVRPSVWSRFIFVLFSRMRNLRGPPLQVLPPPLLKMTRKMASSSAGVPTPSATHLWRNASPSRASQTARARQPCTGNSL